MPTTPKPKRLPWIKQRQKFERIVTDTFYHTPQWRKLRSIYIKRHPLCVDCDKRGEVTRATVVDHIISIKNGGGALDWNNLQSMCETCHNSKSGKEAWK